jgi:guanine nucleotide-binding protein subunit alpha
VVRQDFDCTLLSRSRTSPDYSAQIFRQILFLNKIDLFAEKLPRSPLGDYFPDFNGGNNYEAACDYLLHRFVSLNQSAATKQIYAHYTCATDTQQIKCKSITRPGPIPC